MPDKPRTGFFDWIFGRKSESPKSQPIVTVGWTNWTKKIGVKND